MKSVVEAEGFWTSYQRSQFLKTALLRAKVLRFIFFLIMCMSSVPNFFFKSFAFWTFWHKNVIAFEMFSQFPVSGKIFLCSILIFSRFWSIVHSVEQKSIGVIFHTPHSGSEVRYSSHHNSSHFSFPIFAHSWCFSIFHSLQSITPCIY